MRTHCMLKVEQERERERKILHCSGQFKHEMV